MKIVILMSIYNGEEYIDKQLESIYNQNLNDDETLEIIVRDDGSIDNSLFIVKKWKEKLNLSIIAGKNVGAKESFYELLYGGFDADYYAFCDQDDIWKENKIRNAIDKIRRFESEPVLYFSNMEYMDENDASLNESLLKDGFSLSLKRILMCNPANGCSMLWNREMQDCLKKHKYKCFTMHDEYVLTIAYLQGRVIYDPANQMLYRVHGSNVTQSNSIKKKLQLSKQIWFGNKYASLDKRCLELLTNLVDVKYEDKRVLEEILTYKKNRIFLLRKENYFCENYRIERSFRIRMLLGLL